MTSVQQFNGLNGRVVSRTEIEKILQTAKQENATDVVYRISKILNENPNTEEFEINIMQYPEPQGLAGARHTGNYREALDECGRLKKGWKFVGGNVVKVVKKEKSKKTDKKESKIKTPVVAHDKKRYGKVTKREKKPKEKKYTTAYFEKDLDYQTLYNAYHWNSFSPDKNAERDIKDWAKTMVSLYEAYTEQAQKSQVQEKYDATFDKWHQKLLALKKQIITQQSKTISTAVTGGAGVKQSQIKKNESAWKKINELNNTFLDTLEKAENELQKIAKNTSENEYESGEIIKSTDKFADDKIQQKIQTLQAFVERIKKSEKELKKASENQWKTILINNGFSEKETEEIIDFYQRHGYFYFGKSTTNLNAEIRRLKERLAHTEKIKDNAQENGEDKITEFEGGKIVQNTEEMRLQIHFEDIPSAEIREALKKRAFKWSPKNKVWQRVLTRDAISVVDGFFKNGLFKKKIDEIEKALEKEPQGTHLLLEDTAKKFKISIKEAYAFYDRYRYTKNLEEYAISERDMPFFELFFGKKLNQRFFSSVKKLSSWQYFKNNDFSKEIIEYIDKRRKWNKYKKYGLSAPQLSLTTEEFKKMSVPELRAFTLQYYNENLKGKTAIIKKYLKEVVFTSQAGRKIAKGEAMYSAKTVAVQHLQELIENSTYNNWGDRKNTDNKDVLGYLNFKSKLTIDGEKRHLRISLTMFKNRKTELKNIEVGNKKKLVKPTQASMTNSETIGFNQLSDRKITKNSEKTKQKPKKSGLGLPLTAEIRKKAFTDKGKLRKGWYFTDDKLLTNGVDFFVPDDKNDDFYRVLEKRLFTKKRNIASTWEGVVKKREDLYFEKRKKSGLSAPQTPSLLERVGVRNERNLAQKMASRPTEWEFFRIDNPQMANFLGKVEKKAKDSLVITLAGSAGSGKTRFAFQFINDLAQNYKVGHISMEEEPDSFLYYEKVEQYFNEKALQNIETYDIKSLSELDEVIQRNDVIVIDSFQKIIEIENKFILDVHLRKKYDGKLFLIIYQLTSGKKMRGGSKSEYDGDIILYVEKFDDYRENYVYPDKNRYNSVPANELKYSIFEQRLLPRENQVQPSENQAENLTFDVIM